MKSERRLSDRTASLFDRVFFIMFISLFFLVGTVGMIVVAVVGELGTDASRPVYMIILRYLAILLCFAVVSAGLIWCCRFLLSEKRARLDTKRFFFGTVILTLGAILIVQLVCAYFLQMEPITDVSSVERLAIQVVRDHSFDCIKQGFDSYYIVAYQNNVAYMLIVTGIYQLTYLLTGTFTRIPIIVINTLALNFSIFMTVMTARKLFGERKATFTLILCALFTPYYTYTAYYYTDSLTLPIVSGILFCFISAVQSEKRGKKIGLLLLTGALCLIGFEIKGSVGILIPAILIYLLLQFGIKRAVKIALPLLLSFVILFGSFSAALKASDIIPEELSDRYQYPLTHWVMMGLNGVGGYERADSAYTESFPSKEEKIEANTEQIRERLGEKGFFGNLWHFGRKTVWTWMDGTYYISYYLADYRQHTLLHEFILFDGRYRFLYFALSGGYQMFWLLAMAYSGLNACRKRRKDFTTLLRIAVFGLWLFLLIWETNSRYPFNFSPLYLLLVTDGTAAMLTRYRERKNAKEEKRIREAAQESSL